MDGEIADPQGGRRASARYKYQRLRERLRGALANGELTGKLPGERELARLYKANAKTINKALTDLATEGLLVRHVGRGTFVADHVAEAKAGGRSLRFAWLMAAGSNHSFREALYQQALELFRSRGHVIEHCNTSDGTTSASLWQHLAPSRLRDYNGVIILSARPSSELLADLHRRHLPLVTVNNRHEQITTSAVLPDYASGAFELCQHLVQLGHREIQLLIHADMWPAAAGAESGYRAAMQRHGLRPRSVPPADGAIEWPSLIQTKPGPTALICVGAGLAVAAHEWALKAGLTLPSMLSLVALPEPGETCLAELSVTAYEVSADRLLHWTAELILSASPGVRPRIVLIPGRLVDRGSAAPPNKPTGTVSATIREADYTT